MAGAVAKAKQIIAETDNAVSANQFANPANPRSTRRPPPREVWADTDGKSTSSSPASAPVAPSPGRHVLKARKPDVQIVGVEPKDSPLLTEGRPPDRTRSRASAPTSSPRCWTAKGLRRDHRRRIDDAVRVARELGTEEGILGGISSGAIVGRRWRLAKRPENAGKLIVAVVCDYGERYISTVLYEHIRD